MNKRALTLAVEAGEGTVRREAITCRSWQGNGAEAQGNRLEFRVERR